MPPRRIKKDPKAVEIAHKIEEPLNEYFDELEEKLREVSKMTAKSETDRILDLIPQKFREMNIMTFLTESPSGIFEESDENQENLDDAAHETSIPIAHSGHNSGRNTANEVRHELITPAGQVLTVPNSIHPKLVGTTLKPFRRPHANEEIAFSINGSPMVLGKPVEKENAKKGLLVPKLEEGTAV